jgi:hypothetical protein
VGVRVANWVIEEASCGRVGVASVIVVTSTVLAAVAIAVATVVTTLVDVSPCAITAAGAVIVGCTISSPSNIGAAVGESVTLIAS